MSKKNEEVKDQDEAHELPPEQPLKVYNFPEYGECIEAENLKDAQAKLKEILSAK